MGGEEEKEARLGMWWEVSAKESVARGETWVRVQGLPSASERRANNLKGFKDVYLKTKTRI